jgi:hypothetical protein
LRIETSMSRQDVERVMARYPGGSESEDNLDDAVSSYINGTPGPFYSDQATITFTQGRVGKVKLAFD